MISSNLHPPDQLLSNLQPDEDAEDTTAHHHHHHPHETSEMAKKERRKERIGLFFLLLLFLSQLLAAWTLFSLQSDLTQSIAVAVAFFIAQTFYMSVHWSFVVQRSLKIKGVNIVDILRRKALLKKKGKDGSPPKITHILGAKPYPPIFLLITLSFVVGGAGAILFTLIVDLIFLWTSVPLFLPLLLLLLLGIFEVAFLSWAASRILGVMMKGPVEQVTHLVLPSGETVELDKIKLVLVARRSDRALLLKWSGPLEEEGSVRAMERIAVDHLMGRSLGGGPVRMISSSSSSSSRVYSRLGARLWEDCDDRCVFILLVGLSYEDELCSLFITQLKRFLTHHHYGKHRGIETLGALGWNEAEWGGSDSRDGQLKSGVFHFVESLSAAFSDPDEMIKLLADHDVKKDEG